jgi:hypothetical protein
MSRACVRCPQALWCFMCAVLSAESGAYEMIHAVRLKRTGAEGAAELARVMTWVEKC